MKFHLANKYPVMYKKLTFIVVFFISLSSFAQDIPERPSPQRLVNDMANVLSSSEEDQLESELDQFARSTTTQIAIVTVPTLNGYDASDFAFRLGEKWGVGQKGKDNGVVVLFKPKTADSRGQVFVAVGYGLEGVIPDAIANRDIVDHEMLPRFRQGDTFGGLQNGVKVIMALASHEFTPQQYHEKVSSGAGAGAGVGIFVFILFFFIVSMFRRRRYYTGGSSLPFWLLMGGMMGSNNRGGSWGNFNSGGGSFGGGGGFGGFGGGGFGGGGAGGSW